MTVFRGRLDLRLLQIGDLHACRAAIRPPTLVFRSPASPSIPDNLCGLRPCLWPAPAQSAVTSPAKRYAKRDPRIDAARCHDCLQLGTAGPRQQMARKTWSVGGQFAMPEAVYVAKR